MALKSMKREKKSKEETKKSEIEYKEPDYPWGLEVNLEDDSLKTLGLGAEDFKIGENKDIVAKVRVDNISSNKRRNGKNSDSVRMQITDLDLGGSAKPEKSLFESYKDQTDSGHDVL